jgi:uncharacterized protein (UPF0332 family)
MAPDFISGLAEAASEKLVLSACFSTARIGPKIAFSYKVRMLNVRNFVMKETSGDLMQRLLLCARESLEEAKILGDSGHWNTSVSRLYYSCFYAASALLEKHGLSSEKHSGVRSLFNIHFAKTEKVPKDVSAIYNCLFDRRQESDHSPFSVFEGTDVRPWFDDVDTFVNAISILASQNTEKA